MDSLLKRLEEASSPTQEFATAKSNLLSDIRQSKKMLDAMEKDVSKAKDMKSLVKEKPIFKDFVSFAGEMAAILGK